VDRPEACPPFVKQVLMSPIDRRRIDEYRVFIVISFRFPVDQAADLRYWAGFERFGSIDQSNVEY